MLSCPSTPPPRALPPVRRPISLLPFFSLLQLHTTLPPPALDQPPRHGGVILGASRWDPPHACHSWFSAHAARDGIFCSRTAAGDEVAHTQQGWAPTCSSRRRRGLLDGVLHVRRPTLMGPPRLHVCVRTQDLVAASPARSRVAHEWCGLGAHYLVHVQQAHAHMCWASQLLSVLSVSRSSCCGAA